MPGSYDNQRICIIGEAIEDAVNTQIRSEVEKAVEAAKAQMDARVPEIVAGISIQVMRHVSMRTIGDELLITVAMPKRPL